jgi:trehalose/maltose hydrolase-like predicted phosphorylase
VSLTSNSSGPGSYTLLDVMPPDESAHVINSSVYTNAVAAATLQWGVAASWSVIAADMYMPLNTTLYAKVRRVAPLLVTCHVLGRCVRAHAVGVSRDV